MKKLKKVYVEITNQCNLSCSFCAKTKREKRFITKTDFKIVLNKLNNYTEYLYFHILGEPLLHPDINELINIASKSYKINITTNGYLIKKIKDNKNIRQLNISLHSFSEKYNKTLDEYLEDIFNVADILKKYTFISYRLWTNSKYKEKIINKLNEKYNKEIDLETLNNNTKISENIFISTHQEFIWPNDNEIITDFGTCYALKDHIGILVDGTVVPCCLDSEGVINLGNIFKEDLGDIINSKRYQNMLIGFKKNHRQEDLCKRCNFK